MDTMQKEQKKKKEVIVTALQVRKARLPNVSGMTLAVWRLFIDIRIPSEVDEFYQDFDGNYHFIKYE